ncbi:MAG: methionyl-tRNA formyltransferase, partial [Alphaproteobacteria bacterium]|nr:methionyl-tRNA formyltransferase [Alphaproteobacteria bacterium]
AGLIIEALAQLESLSPVPQSEHGVTYAEKIDKAEARVDWRQPAAQVDRLIRGLSPFPGAWAMIGDERIKFLQSEVVDLNGAPGEVLDGLVIACGDGAIRITRAQRQGKRAMQTDELLRGLDLPDRLS